MVNGWGHWLGLVALILLIGSHRSRVHVVAAVIGGAGLGLLLVPIVQARALNTSLPPALTEAFGPGPGVTSTGAAPRAAPFVPGDLVLGVRARDIAVDQHEYAVVRDEPLWLDLYRPEFAEGLLPVVMMIHGGGWTEGDRRDLAPLNRYLASRGYVVAAISYRLAPEWQFPAPQEDLASAIAYVKSLELTHGVDPTRIALVGRSAGAHIALVGAYTTNDPAVRGVASYYGPAAMRWGYSNPARPGVIDSSGVLEAYLGGPPSTRGEQYDAAEPARFVTPETPPTLFIQGLRDEHVSPFHAEFVSDRLIEAGVPFHILRMPWATHACDFVFSGPCGQASTFAVEWFLHAVLYRGTDLDAGESS